MLLSDAVQEVSHETRAFSEGNAVKVRRVMQIIQDLTNCNFEDLRILDLGCAGGIYSLEAGSRGAKVVGIDGRDLRMKYGIKTAERLGFSNIEFMQEDVRNLTENKLGEFDIVLFLGLLYHFDVPDVFHILTNIYRMCKSLMIVDTHIALTSEVTVEHEGNVYYGRSYIETSGDVSSLNNPKSFWFTRESLFRLMNNLGFTSVYECCIPLEPTKPIDRLTLVALKRNKVKILIHPWINDISEHEIEVRLKKCR